MDSLSILFALSLLACAVPLSAVVSGRLDARRDYFIIILYAEFIVYLHLAPTLWAFEVAESTRLLYAYLQFACLTLFEWPFLFLYLKMRRKQTVLNRCVVVDSRRQFFLAVSAFVLTLFFLLISLSNDVFFLRVGPDEAVARLLSLPFHEFVVYRSFQVAGAFLLCVLIASLLHSRGQANSTKGQGFVIAATAMFGLTFVLNKVFNSRGHSIVVIAMLLGTVIYFGKKKTLTRNVKAFALAALLLAVYGSRVAVNVRNIYVGNGLQWSILNPFMTWEQPDDLNDLRFRLNGIDLMARITPEAQRTGFARGEAWEAAALTMIGQVTLGQVVSLEEVAEHKESFLVTPKRYLMWRYLDLDWADYSSCVLTDVYGNFGFLGLFFMAPVMAWLSARITKGLTQKSSPFAVLASLFLAFHLLIFEQELAALVTAYANTLPILIVAALANPFVLRAATSEGSAVTIGTSD